MKFIISAEVKPCLHHCRKKRKKSFLTILPKGDQAARSMLIERNLRLVVYIARKFENTGINIEDLISIGTIGLIKAVNTFNPEKK